VKLHANPGKILKNLLQQDSFVLHVLILDLWILRLDPLHNKNLVLLLLIHDQILAADDNKPIFTLRLLKSNDLVRLSGLSCE
jgi:hypothetical protein